MSTPTKLYCYDSAELKLERERRRRNRTERCIFFLLLLCLLAAAAWGCLFAQALGALFGY